MHLKRIGIALPPMPISDFITYVLKRHRAPTTLLICSSKEIFLKDLLSSVVETASELQDESSEVSASQHYLLNPTIHLVARSSSVNLVFVPTLPHLRAYLEIYGTSSESASSVAFDPNSDHLVPFLAVWGLVHLHRSTADYSAQGLSRTLASAVEAVSYESHKLVLAEPQLTPERGESENPDPPDTTSDSPWKDRVPLLSGSIRYGGGERNLAGNTTEIGSILAKWCTFIKLDQDSHVV